MPPLAHIRRLRNLPRNLLAVLLLTVAQTAWVPCAMAATPTMSAAMPAMDEHCTYCPADSVEVNIAGCLFPHAPSVDVVAFTAHQVDVLLASPLLLPATFDLTTLRASRSFVPIDIAAPIPSRPLILTHCVQLK